MTKVLSTAALRYTVIIIIIITAIIITILPTSTKLVSVKICAQCKWQQWQLTCDHCILEGDK